MLFLQMVVVWCSWALDVLRSDQMLLSASWLNWPNKTKDNYQTTVILYKVRICAANRMQEIS